MKYIADIKDFIDAPTEQSVTHNLVQRFKKRRKECGFSQKDLAQRSGVSYASIRRFETSGDISLSSLVKLAHAIGRLEDFNELFAQQIIKSLKGYGDD